MFLRDYLKNRVFSLLGSEYAISIAILMTGMIFFVGYVWADTASTTVTVGNEAPTVTVTLDRTTITLTENTFTWASSTVSVTDTNGCSEITKVQAYLVHATTSADSIVQTCSYDSQTCYVPTSCIATTSPADNCAGGADTTVDYDCGFQVWYNARPTAASPGLPTAFWYVVASSTDGSLSGTATNTTQTVNVAVLNALNITGTIGYPQTSAGANTGATNQTVTHTNTGNTNIDNEISGDIMCTDYSACTGDSFGEDQQKFGTSDVTYSSLTNTLAATSSPATIELNLATTTATTTAITTATYWGIAIPSAQPAGSYTGQNTFSAVAD